jgi:hypothetical protein
MLPGAQLKLQAEVLASHIEEASGEPNVRLLLPHKQWGCVDRD